MSDRGIWHPDYQEDLSSEDIETADKDTQIEIMKTWFFSNYEDPAEHTPYESKEGGYIYIWGGPYDAREELESMFAGLVPDEIIEELANELSDICWEWAGVIQSDHIDDYYLSAVASNTEFHETLLKSIENIKLLLTVEVGPVLRQQYLQLLHVNVIAALETFLSDAFINTVLNDEKLIRKFVETNPEFKERKLTLKEIFERYEKINSEIKTYLLELIWHNLAKAKQMYKSTLDIEFNDDIKNIYKAIAIRHDLVHRNGKTKEGNEIIIEEEGLNGIIQEISDFALSIDQQFN